MATTQSKIRNLYLGAAELKKLTDWPDIVIEFLLSMAENIIVTSTDIDINNGDLSIPPSQGNLLAEFTELEKGIGSINNPNFNARLAELEDKIARIESRININDEEWQDLIPRPIPYQEKRFGNGASYTEFEYDGTMRHVGGATVWRDDNSGAVSLGAGATAPDLVQIDGGTIETRAFNGTAITEQLFGGTEYNHEGKEGADIIFHIHWSPTTANAGNVKWQLSYKWVNVDGSFVGAETTISVIQAASGTAWDAQKISFSPISGAGKTIGSQLAFRLFRNPLDAADTYPDDAAITMTIGYHYEIDTGGSREITTK